MIDIQRLSANFFEWGIRCDELETDSEQVPGVTPIGSISFSWSTVQPEIFRQIVSDNTRRTYGVGQCKFEMYHSPNKCNIQDAFKMQTLLREMQFIRFINDSGKSLEYEKYIFQGVIISTYEFESKPDQIGERDVVSIVSTGEHKYIQIIRENGKAIGQKVTRQYNAQKGFKIQ